MTSAPAAAQQCWAVTLQPPPPPPLLLPLQVRQQEAVPAATHPLRALSWALELLPLLPLPSPL